MPTEVRLARPARDERASALVLVPAMMLVLICLGGIAIDMSLVHGAHRAAHRTVSTAADDAAAMLDDEHLQLTGELRIDPQRAERVALAQLRTNRPPGRLVGDPVLRIDPGGDALTLVAVVQLDHVLLSALPGVGTPERITVQATGRLNR